MVSGRNEQSVINITRFRVPVMSLVLRTNYGRITACVIRSPCWGTCNPCCGRTRGDPNRMERFVRSRGRPMRVQTVSLSAYTSAHRL